MNKNISIKTNADRVYAVIRSKGIKGLTRAQLISFGFSGMSSDAIMSAVRTLKNNGLVRCKRHGNYMSYIDVHAGDGGELPNLPIAMPKTSPPTDHYTPPKGLYEVARPEGLHHQRHGSRQADGSIKPFGPPVSITASV